MIGIQHRPTGDEIGLHFYWRNNISQFTSNLLREGLRGRAITRDLEWGVPVPVDSEHFKDKRIYVWFDAVIGYYSASIEWAERIGSPANEFYNLEGEKMSTSKGWALWAHEVLTQFEPDALRYYPQRVDLKGGTQIGIGTSLSSASSAEYRVSPFR